jgi:hypothetical protein
MRSAFIVLALASMAVAALPIIEPFESQYNFTLLHTTITLTPCLDIAVRNPEPQRNAQADYYVKREPQRNAQADYYKRDPQRNAQADYYKRDPQRNAPADYYKREAESDAQAE